MNDNARLYSTNCLLVVVGHVCARIETLKGKAKRQVTMSRVTEKDNYRYIATCGRRYRGENVFKNNLKRRLLDSNTLLCQQCVRRSF